jgi:hypothetical protein
MDPASNGTTAPAGTRGCTKSKKKPTSKRARETGRGNQIVVRVPAEITRAILAVARAELTTRSTIIRRVLGNWARDRQEAGTCSQ